MNRVSFLAFFAFAVVGFFAAVEAKSIFDFPYEEAPFETLQSENMWRSLKEFQDPSDSKDPGRPTCSCQKKTCKCCVRVDDTQSGIKGVVCLVSVYFSNPGRLEFWIFINGQPVFEIAAITDILERFQFLSCAQSKSTKGRSVCVLIQGNGTTVDKNINGCANLVILDSPTLNVDFGCFNLNYSSVSVGGRMDSSPFHSAGIRELYKTAEERILLKERILMKNNFPRMDDEEM